MRPCRHRVLCGRIVKPPQLSQQPHLFHRRRLDRLLHRLLGSLRLLRHLAKRTAGRGAAWRVLARHVPYDSAAQPSCAERSS